MNAAWVMGATIGDGDTQTLFIVKKISTFVLSGSGDTKTLGMRPRTRVKEPPGETFTY